MAFDFPASPTIDQVFTDPTTGVTYQWDGVGWRGGPVTTGVSGVSVGDTPPSLPVQGGLWWESDTGKLFVNFDDGTSKQWVQVNWSPNPSSAYVAKAGDDMTGTLRIKPASSDADFVLDKPASGTAARIWGKMNGLTRWHMAFGNNLAESGSGVGSDFTLSRYNDAATLVDQPIWVQRSTGNVTLANNLVLTPGYTGNPSIVFSKPVGANINGIYGRTNNVDRWVMYLGNAETESGANAGSNFAISRCNDAGTYLDAPIQISRANGQVTFASQAIKAPGYACRAGVAGPYGGNIFNINYVAPAQLWIDSTNLGTISITSDYRTKDNIEALPSMWEAVKTLRPVSFEWKEFGIFKPDDEGPQYGFVAHELQEDLIHSAAGGEKDEENRIQNLNLAPVVAALTKALQEAMARIEALEARHV